MQTPPLSLLPIQVAGRQDPTWDSYVQEVVAVQRSAEIFQVHFCTTWASTVAARRGLGVVPLYLSSPTGPPARHLGLLPVHWERLGVPAWQGGNLSSPPYNRL